MVFDHDFRAFPELTNAQLETLRFLSPHPQIEEDFDAVVERVHDGDTITVSTSSRDFVFPVRLLDIDAPELSEGGEFARDWLRARILGKDVRILVDPRDRVGKYGRLLGRVFSQGLDVGGEMLVQGLVKPFGTKREGEPEPLMKLFRLEQWFS